MKQYLCRVRTTDGDHEYLTHVGAFGSTRENALNQVTALIASGWFDFQDGTTRSWLVNAIQMTDEEELVLRKFKII